MKKYLFILLFHCSASMVNRISAQPGQWTWMHGDSAFTGTGNFGTQGIPSVNNDPPHLYECCEWTDLNGNFWMYGGLDDNNGIQIHNDLWKYDPLTNEWTWMTGTNAINDHGVFGIQGISSPANRPPGLGYGAASWVDLNGDLWMFGGWCDSSYCDLWKYHIASNEWTWIKGPGTGNNNGNYGVKGVPSVLNNPRARSECATAWTDNAGDLWLFGGEFGPLFNDLWRFNIASNTWTWMKGDTASQLGNWGVIGVEDSLNTPGGRWSYARWKDNGGNLWLFGGQGFDATGGNWYMNDLWKYNPATNNWTWMHGSKFGNSSGSYGTRCVSSPSNVPPHRFENRAAWKDQNGNFWMFGGMYKPGIFSIAGLNDLWFYCVSSNEWIWAGGDSLPNTAGRWGTKGVSDPLNLPGGRNGAVAWGDNNGHLYLFGGSDANFGSMYNDLWKFEIDPSCISSCATAPVASFTAPHHVCPGTCTDFTNLSSNATSFQWTFAGATPGTSTDANPTGICYNTPGSYSVSLVASNATASDTLTLNNYIIVYPYPSPQGITQNGDTLFANAGATSYQWYYNGNVIPGATDFFYIAPESGDYNVVATDANNCEVEAAIFNVVASVNPETVAGLPVIAPVPVHDQLFISWEKQYWPEQWQVSVRNLLGEEMMKPETYHASPLDCRQLSPGIYYLEINSASQIVHRRFVKQ